MKRRKFITLLGGAAAWPMAVPAQQPERVRRIGVLNTFAADDQEGHRRVAAFLQALQPLGWTIGHNVGIEHRWGSGDPASTRKNAEELAALAPDAVPRAWRRCCRRLAACRSCSCWSPIRWAPDSSTA